MPLSESLRAVLDQEPHVAMLLDPAGTISFLNREWTSSAERDGALPDCHPSAVLGRAYLDFVAGTLKASVSQAFIRAAALQPGFHSVWLHSECNTATHCRKLTTRIAPLWERGDEGPASGFMVHHQLRVVGTLSEQYPLVELHVDAWGDQLITQCGCCRRVREPRGPRWVMCLALLERSAANTSHGLCELCVETYYR